MGQAKEPGPETGLHPIGAAGLDQVGPDILEQLLGNGRVATAMEQIAIKGAAMALVKDREGLPVAIAVAQHQVFVSGFGHGGYPRQKKVILSWRCKPALGAMRLNGPT
jgi:hypothetical protein